MTTPERTVWCSRCQTHRALPHKGLCPVCLDDDTQPTPTTGGPQ